MAQRIELRVPHTLTLEEARARMEALGDYYRARHHASVSWHEDVVTIDVRYLGVRVSVRARLEAHAVQVDASDPGFLLRSRGAKYLDAKIRRYLHEPLATLPRA